MIAACKIPQLLLFIMTGVFGHDISHGQCDNQICVVKIVIIFLYFGLFHSLSKCEAGESVLSALAGCKILRELSKLETETETKLSMKELAQTFENLAHGGCESR